MREGPPARSGGPSCPPEWKRSDRSIQERLRPLPSESGGASRKLTRRGNLPRTVSMPRGSHSVGSRGELQAREEIVTAELITISSLFTVEQAHILEILERKSLIDEYGCHVWTGPVDARGYGRFSAGGVTSSAHRVAFLTLRGPIPSGLMVRHRCDNPPCIKPFHLELGTAKDNVDDHIRRHGWATFRGRSSCMNGHTLYSKNVGRRPMGSTYCLICYRANLRALELEELAA